MTWTLVKATAWTGGPVSAVAQMQVLQDGWADATGFIFEIDAGDTLVATGGGFATPLLRPQSEIGRDVLVDMLLNAPTNGFLRVGATVRIGEANPIDGFNYETVPFYAFELHVNGADPLEQYVRWSFYLADHSFGYETVHDFGFKALVPFEAGHSYRMVCSVVGEAITVGRVFVRDLTDNVDLIGTTAVDVNDIIYEEATHTPEARLQVAGRVGLASETSTSNIGDLSIYSQPVEDPSFPSSRGNN